MSGRHEISWHTAHATWYLVVADSAPDPIFIEKAGAFIKSSHRFRNHDDLAR